MESIASELESIMSDLYLEFGDQSSSIINRLHKIRCAVLKVDDFAGIDDLKTWKAEQFEIFWNKYPLKLGKKKAKEQWMKLSKEDIEKAVNKVDDFIAYKPFKDYTHPWPERYIRHKRFDDDIPVAKKKYIAKEDMFAWKYDKE